MNPIKSLRKMFSGNQKAIDLAKTDLVGWHGIGGMNNTYRHFRDNQYENGYASITKIADAFSMLRPYAINAKGDKIKNPKAVDLLYTPNTTMSGADFREALAVMSLVHPQVHILVWTLQDGVLTAGGPVTDRNIAGYTFLENAVRTVSEGKVTYTVDGQTYDDSEVISLYDTNPYDLSRGYSPAQAAHKWTKLDDYIAAYQAGFFENGAVPAGMFKIVAKTKQDYEDIVDKMQKKHRGSGKNNNVAYSHTPLDPAGKPVTSQIEWVPFNTNNKDMALKDIFEQVNKKIDSVYGVPSSIRGVNDNNTYASVRVDEQIFVKYVVQPFAEKIWNKFTHELNRITGGINAAITVDILVPGVAEEEKLQAETKNLDTANIVVLLGQGYTLESIIDSLGYDEGYKKLVKAEPVAPVADNTQTTDNPDVLADDAVQDNLDATNDANKAVKTKQMSSEQRSMYESRIADVQRRQMEKQIDKAVNDVASKAVGDVNDEDLTEYVAEMLAVLVPLMVMLGTEQYIVGTNLVIAAGIDASATTSYFVSPEQVARYKEYLKSVGLSYSTETAEEIRNVLARSLEQGLTTAQTQTQLRNIMQTDEWRVTRIATTEANRAGSQASIYAMEQIQKEVEVKIEKIWNNSSSDPCPYCKALHGTVVAVDSTFAPVGATITGSDGSTMVNNFVSMETTSAHPGCHCYPTYKVTRS